MRKLAAKQSQKNFLSEIRPYSALAGDGRKKAKQISSVERRSFEELIRFMLITRNWNMVRENLCSLNFQPQCFILLHTTRTSRKPLIYSTLPCLHPRTINNVKTLFIPLASDFSVSFPVSPRTGNARAGESLHNLYSEYVWAAKAKKERRKV